MNMLGKVEFAYFMGRYTKASLGDIQSLLRLTATHKRLETELTNGYKTKSGNWDDVRTNAAKAKRDRIDSKIEKIAQTLGVEVEYGALTVSLTVDNREVYIP